MSPEPAEDNSVRSVVARQFTASVLVEGKEAPLYGTEESDDGKTVSCWVESESGKTFGIRWEDTIRLTPTAGWVSVDGINCSGLIMRTGINDKDWALIDYCDSGAVRSKLAFSDIKTTDEDEYHGQAVSEDFGAMKLVIKRIDILGIEKPYLVPEKRTLDKIHERSKKAMQHQARLGEQSAIPKHCIEIIQHEILATFIIRYRPKGYLQAEGIMPLLKKRKADPEDVIDLTIEDDEESGDEELRELQARIKAIQDKKKQKPNKRVKTEVKQEPIVLS